MSIISWACPKWTKWIDVGMFDDCGVYKLIQMKIDINTNRKKFKTRSMGFVNDYTQKTNIYLNIKRYDNEIN